MTLRSKPKNKYNKKIIEEAIDSAVKNEGIGDFIGGVKNVGRSVRDNYRLGVANAHLNRFVGDTEKSWNKHGPAVVTQADKLGKSGAPEAQQLGQKLKAGVDDIQKTINVLKQKTQLSVPKSRLASAPAPVEKPEIPDFSDDAQEIPNKPGVVKGAAPPPVPAGLDPESIDKMTPDQLKRLSPKQRNEIISYLRFKKNLEKLGKTPQAKPQATPPDVGPEKNYRKQAGAQRRQPDEKEVLINYFNMSDREKSALSDEEFNRILNIAKKVSPKYYNQILQDRSPHKPTQEPAGGVSASPPGQPTSPQSKPNAGQPGATVGKSNRPPPPSIQVDDPEYDPTSLDNLIKRSGQAAAQDDETPIPLTRLKSEPPKPPTEKPKQKADISKLRPQNWPKNQKGQADAMPKPAKDLKDVEKRMNPAQMDDLKKTGAHLKKSIDAKKPAETIAKLTKIKPKNAGEASQRQAAQILSKFISSPPKNLSDADKKNLLWQAQKINPGNSLDIQNFIKDKLALISKSEAPTEITPSVKPKQSSKNAAKATPISQPENPIEQPKKPAARFKSPAKPPLTAPPKQKVEMPPAGEKVPSGRIAARRGAFNPASILKMSPADIRKLPPEDAKKAQVFMKQYKGKLDDPKLKAKLLRALRDRKAK